MKKKAIVLPITVIGLVVIISIALSNALSNETNEREVSIMGNPKTLIVYYSRTGNTKVVAELIQEKLGGDLFQIETQEQRPSNYRKEVEKNEEEQEDSLLPELKTKISNFNQYDRIFIGTPTWNMALPQAILTFMDSYEFAGKTVIPFNTNGGYGTGSTFNQIKSSVQGAEVLDGYSVKGGEETKGTILAIEGERKVEVSREIDTWLEKIGQLNN
ncbi:flavodoxin [Listeria monocytogenes]|uniref:flavodoxin n=1 Tax=Listeria monocytogenes TaxID=1639 RepID=UPI002118B1DB|nr:flavodoxin [Listeria monocytogenes]